MTTVAVFDAFLSACARLPRATQRKVRDFSRRFSEWPTMPAFALEHPDGARDGNVHLTTVGPDLAAVVLHPQSTETYVMLWVGRPGEAREWARDKTFSVHPATGALQVFDMRRLTSYVSDVHDVADTALAATGATARAPRGLFAGRRDAELLALGVPQVLLPAVRALRDAAGLRELCFHLPAEAAEALLHLACGVPAEDVLAAAPPPVSPPDVQDYETALSRPDTRHRFVVLRSPDELETMLDAPLERWRLFLHPSQERLVSGHQSGPCRVLGGAGTGKTVVAMHRARRLARDVFRDPVDRILLTTFTVNLAQNLRDLMRGFSGEEMGRIDVENLHAWASQYARAHGFEQQVASDEQARQAWEEAAAALAAPARDPSFYEAEWRLVVAPAGISTLRGYLQARRSGRGDSLSREEREDVWKVMERFRDVLRARGLVLWSDLMRSVAEHVGSRADGPPYRAAVVDETQDFGLEELKLIRALVKPGPDDLFLVGDAHQRIYGQPLPLSRAGIDTRGRTAELRLNYRTTEQIRDWAVQLLAGRTVDDLDEGTDGQEGYVSLLDGVPPQVRVLEDARAEVAFLSATLPELVRDHGAESVCIVARSRRLLNELALPALEQARLGHVLLERQADRDAGAGVRVATMHRVKGLEFGCVLVVGLTAGAVPYRPAAWAVMDAQDQERHDLTERCLLYVASTRARDRLFLVAGGVSSPFLAEVRSRA